MTEIRFYHLQTRTLEQVLPELLAKGLSTGRRIVVRTADKNAAEALNDLLWIYKPDSFLPHGCAKDGHAEHQPIWLTPDNDNPNAADILVLTKDCRVDDIESYTLCCDIFDGNDEIALSAARQRWKLALDAGHALTYWQQTDKGWEKKTG